MSLGLAIVLAVGIFSGCSLVKSYLRHRSIMKHGWPPVHIHVHQDADGGDDEEDDDADWWKKDRPRRER